MTNEATQPAVMWWDGGERAITAREKALIEEHSASSFSIPLMPAQTPGARWTADGQADPHGRQYECERAALTLGHYTDDELANAVFLHGNEQPSMAALAAGKALPGIAYLTAAKERIRWLSRHLAAALAVRQPVGQEPRAWLIHWSHIPLEAPEATTSASRVDAVSALTDPPRIEPLYAAQPAQGIDLGPIATRKLGELAAQGYVTNGVAIFNPATGHRGLVDNMGYVGRQEAQRVHVGAGVRAIADERRRQVQAEGFSPATDADYNAGELAKAALAYVQLAAMDLAAGGRDHIATGSPPACWPWHPVWWKPRNARRDLVRAGALIAAQLDLIDSARDAAPEVARG